MDRKCVILFTHLCLIILSITKAEKYRGSLYSDEADDNEEIDANEPEVHPQFLFCSYNGATYKAGERFRPDPCTACHCPWHSNRVNCAVKDCRLQPNCARYVKEPDDCCEVCVEIGCLHNDGRVYRPGQVVVDSQCETCVCPQGGGRVECTAVQCPPVNCVDPIQPPGQCCQLCPNGPNCWLGGRIIPAANGRVYRRDQCSICRCPKYPLPFWMRGNKIQAVCSNICH